MVYVHPLSQVVLEYLQDYHHSWVVSKGLDRSLVLHRDGSFEAKYPVPSSSNDNHNARKYDAATKGRFADIAATETNNMRIWTSYDEQEKKHWLTVRKGLFRQRFLLQDNLLSAWQGNRGTSIPERIHVAVDEMIRAVDRMEQQQQSPNAMMGHPQQRQQKGQSRSRKR
eukprot:jgi/Psemu1/255992/estExt_Genewise1Plus.C_1650031